MEWLYPLSGFVVGAVVGLTGMGGGSLMTPLLILLFGMHPLTAVGTDLLYAAVTKTAGTAIHSRRGNVDWSVAALLAAGSIPATVLTIWVLSLMPRENPGTASIISISTGVALIIAAVAIFLRRHIRNYALARADDPTRTRYSGPITVVFGALLGVLVPLCSVGAGALGVAVLFFLYPRLPPARIVGSDLAHAVPLTLVAGLGHWLIGDVDWHIVGSLLLGSLPGIYFGSHLAAQIPDRILTACPSQYLDADWSEAHRLVKSSEAGPRQYAPPANITARARAPEGASNDRQHPLLPALCANGVPERGLHACVPVRKVAASSNKLPASKRTLLSL